MLKKYDFYVRLFVVLLAMIQPYIIYNVYEGLSAISLVWGTMLEPLFVTTNALTSYYLFSTKNWEFPALCLLLLTAFSLAMFPITHNVIAIIFFLSVIYPLYKAKRFKFVLWMYPIAIPIGYFWGVFWAETWGIVVMCLYHLCFIMYKKYLSLKRNKI
jgi:hypothetical protein